MESPTDDILIGQQTAAWAERSQIPATYLNSCPSTSDLAKDECMTEELDSVPIKIYLTDLQTKGRGRGSHSWLSENPGQQLLMTLSFLAEEAPLPTLSPRLGLALWTAANACWPTLHWSLKAPNDLYLGDKKLAGLLLENVLQGTKTRTLIGLGLNVFDSPQAVPTATNLIANLPEGAPLLAEDWFQFCDRVMLEFSLSLSQGSEALSTSDQLRLLFALNKFPHLKKPYSKIDSAGNLWIDSKKTSWLDL